MEVRLGTWFGVGFGLWVRRFRGFGPVFAGWFVWCRAAVWRYFVESGPSGFPGLGVEVEEHGVFVAMEPCVAVAAEQNEVVDVGRPFAWRFPGQQVVGHTFGVVGAALHAAAVTTNQLSLIHI